MSERSIGVTDRLVIPGMIDTHAHVFEHVTGRFGLNPDLVGVRSGVTAVIDAGGVGWMTFPAFRHYIAERANTRVFSTLSIYVIGALEGNYYPDLYGPDCIDVEDDAWPRLSTVKNRLPIPSAEPALSMTPHEIVCTPSARVVVSRNR